MEHIILHSGIPKSDDDSKYGELQRKWQPALCSTSLERQGPVPREGYTFQGADTFSQASLPSLCPDLKNSVPNEQITKCHS